jgi:hypothetical protein
MFMKKGQAALEFLMTYGWAILIVVVVVAALFAMNVFNPGAFVGETVSGFGSFQVTGHSYSQAGLVNFTLGNKLGTQITITNVDVTAGGTTASDSASNTLGPNQQVSYSISGLPASTQGAQYSAEVEITYTWQGQTKYDNGVISGKTS